MTRPEPRSGHEPSGSPLVVRNRVNQCWGWLIALGIPLVILWLDPLDLYPPDRNLDWAFALTIESAILSIGSYAVFARPRVEVWPDRLIIRNVFRDVSAPFGAITEIDDRSSTWIRIRAGGKWYTAAGTELSTLDGFRGPSGERMSAARVFPEGDVASGEVAVRWRSLERVEVALLVTWLSYIVLGTAVS